MSCIMLWMLELVVRGYVYTNFAGDLNKIKSTINNVLILERGTKLDPSYKIL